MMCAHRILFLVLVLCLLAPVLAAGVPDADQASPQKASRWESNLSVGAVLHQRFGIIKSFWWYALPRVVAIGLTLDHVGPFIPLSLGVALNAPIPVVVPFVCAGAGSSLTYGGITNYGGGLKFRIWQKMGFIVEYRKFHFKEPDPLHHDQDKKVVGDYVGAGIAYIY